MSFPLQVEKAIQAIGVLFRHDGVKRMNYMRLLKLLYIADREALAETGRVITGGPVVAMERGPVLEGVYELIRGQHKNIPLWDRYLKKDKYAIELVDDPDVKKLSRYEIQKLQTIAERHQNDDEWALSQITHTFAEWKKNDPGTSCRPIPLVDVLESIGLAGSAKEIADDVEHLARMQRDLGRQA